MDNLDDLKTIWHTAKTDMLPSSNDILHIVRNFRRQKLRGKWVVIISSFLLSCLIIIILCIVDFKLPTTYIGGGLIAISSILLAITNIRSQKRFYQLDDCSHTQFLAFIEKTRQNQIYYYKKTQVVIMLLCSVGLLLYLHELMIKNTIWFIAVGMLSLVYLLIMWFVVRRRNFRKDQEKLNAIRQQLEKILKQLQ